MYKILLGIPAMFLPKELVNEKGLIVDYELKNEDDDGIWCDFEVYQDEEGYHLDFETMLGFEGKDGCRNWIIECLSIMTDYMDSHNLDKTRELNMYEVFTQGINIKTTFDCIEDVYAFMKLMVFGFHGNGLEIGGE